MKNHVLYNRISILVFSLLLTGFCGALMLSHNLREVGKRKIIVPLVIITLIIDGIMFQVIKNVTSDSLVRLLVPNAIAGIILSFPIWDMYLAEVDGFESKSLWLPFFIIVVLYGGLIAANISIGN